MSEWNPEQYLKFSTERTQPAIDLLNRVRLESPAEVLDIGCGPGNSTAELWRRFPNARILGVDSSKNMIGAAAEQYPELEFAVCDASSDLPALGRKFDLFFSNACIQWVPEHGRLIPEMMKILRPGGVLAVQTPMNYEEPIHRIIGQTVNSAKWKPHFPNPRIFYNLTPGEYFDLLSGLTDEFSLWSTTYYHVMPSHGAILEWYRATGLRPYLEALKTVSEQKEFEQEIFAQVQQAYPMQKNGKIIFRFPRFFFTAVKTEKSSK